MFGLRESLINICLVNKNNPGGNGMETMMIENRIALLSGRDPVGNMRIINKLKRRLRRLTSN